MSSTVNTPTTLFGGGKSRSLNPVKRFHENRVISRSTEIYNLLAQRLENNEIQRKEILRDEAKLEREMETLKRSKTGIPQDKKRDWAERKVALTIRRQQNTLERQRITQSQTNFQSTMQTAENAVLAESFNKVTHSLTHALSTSDLIQQTRDTAKNKAALDHLNKELTKNNPFATPDAGSSSSAAAEGGSMISYEDQVKQYMDTLDQEQVNQAIDSLPNVPTTSTTTTISSPLHTSISSNDPEYWEHQTLLMRLENKKAERELKLKQQQQQKTIPVAIPSTSPSLEVKNNPTSNQGPLFSPPR